MEDTKFCPSCEFDTNELCKDEYCRMIWRTCENYKLRQSAEK